MIEDAIKAITQMFSPPLRSVLWKSIALAIALIILAAIGLDRAIVWLIGNGSTSVEVRLGPHAHWPAEVIAWLLSFAAGFGVVVGGIMRAIPGQKVDAETSTPAAAK